MIWIQRNESIKTNQGQVPYKHTYCHLLYISYMSMCVYKPSNQWLVTMSGIILGTDSANERHYIVTSSFIGCAHTQNDPCNVLCLLGNQYEIKVHGAYMGPIWGPTGPAWAPCWPHESWYIGKLRVMFIIGVVRTMKSWWVTVLRRWI